MFELFEMDLLGRPVAEIGSLEKGHHRLFLLEVRLVELLQFMVRHLRIARLAHLQTQLFEFTEERGFGDDADTTANNR